MGRSLHQQFFDQQAHIWKAMDRRDQIRRLVELFSRALPSPGKRVLDVGCGTGILLDVFCQMDQAPEIVVELDISREMLCAGRSRGPLPNTLVWSVQADTHRLPFPEAYFSGIICFSAFPHFSNQRAVLEEFYRVLGPEGLVMILHLDHHREINRMHASIGGVVRGDRLPPVTEVGQWLMNIGFMVLRAREQRGLYLIVALK
ncbi:MAG: methyltransferase domain-containing protein [Calditrichaeota bacterium]|nr:methyltransferase domain-containing protein [Calditrichota bacterium]